MHLGNIRTALMNYLLAQQQKGTLLFAWKILILSATFDPGAVKILEDLAWLGLAYQEGPHKDGGYGPYYQSQKNPYLQKKIRRIYQEQSCLSLFCTQEELDKNETDKLHFKNHHVTIKLALNSHKKHQIHNPKLLLFIWRMKLNPTQTITIQDLSHGPVTFDMRVISLIPYYSSK